MSVDPWIRELADVNREKQAEEHSRLDGRWDRLSGGDLSPEEEAELLALAESSGEGRAAYEAFRPLGPEFHAQVAKTLRDRGLVPEASTAKRKLLPFRKRTARFAGWGSLAAVAAILLVTVLRPPAPLPSYTASLEGGLRTSRGSESGTVGPFVEGSLLTFDAVPDQAVTGPVEARGFAACGKELVQIEAEPEVAPTGGNVRLRGYVGKDIRLSPGTCKIWLVVCRPGKLPAVDELRGQLNDGQFQHAGCQATESKSFEVRDQV
ncbi:MAG TPA: hypothetical protein VLE27_14870 [Thermoanaerobaculia bacterium]|nr:hypothetical protein [Thermoanaerobaculia bacterium]